MPANKTKNYHQNNTRAMCEEPCPRVKNPERSFLLTRNEFAKERTEFAKALAVQVAVILLAGCAAGCRITATCHLQPWCSNWLVSWLGPGLASGFQAERWGGTITVLIILARLASINLFSRVHLFRTVRTPNVRLAALMQQQVLDRSAFTQTLTVPALRLPKSRCSDLLKRFRG